MKKQRILQGVTGQAGQPHAIAAGLKELGFDARTLAVANHKFNYPVDIRLDLSGTRTLSESYKLIHPIAENFDVFHFHARSFLVDWPDGKFPAALDLILLKLMGKKVFFHYRGQEIRLASVFSEMNPYHYVNEASGHLFQKMPDDTKIRMRDFITSICDGVFVTDPELQTYVPGSVVVPRALDAKEWDFVGVSDRDIPVVIHAPSRRGVKGTNALLTAVSELQSEGLKFDFRLVENMSHADASQSYKDADIIVDQLRIGWYGVLSCEAMALGKPVIAFIRDDLWQTHGDQLPLINANPDTIKSELRALIGSKELRKSLSNKARAYFLKVHSSDEVARLLMKLYNLPSKQRTDLLAVAKLLDHQMSSSIDQVARAHQSRSVRRRLKFLYYTFRADGIIAASKLILRFIKIRTVARK